MAMTAKRPKRGVPEGLWQKCPGCGGSIYKKEVEKHLGCCPECDHHLYVSARERVAQVLDEGTFEEWDAEVCADRSAGFVDKKAVRRTA